ncbi:hypothetical protein J5U21_01582 [Saccharolobus shibatae]|uniref:Uncharacterized protein n=1 Tax=Saccharolobus shibatae TaxID=2286 RepID=A0A8F5BVA2_9CREN|nr:hypothetical protein J5U21_01582 [Saccharolobus shibatae]
MREFPVGDLVEEIPTEPKAGKVQGGSQTTLPIYELQG